MMRLAQDGNLGSWQWNGLYFTRSSASLGAKIELRLQDEITHITNESTNEIAEYDVYLDGYFLGSKRVY